MTKPTAGGTKHSWLVDDLSAVVADLKRTADAILRNLTDYQESREEIYLTNVNNRTAHLFQEIARITAVLAEMRLLIESARPARGSQADVERIEGELAELRALIERIAGDMQEKG
jgi:uncharacterized protein YydD (DUF2326 family)